jgi:hypothetical protein
VGDSILDIVWFDADRRRDLMKWLDAPQDDPAPVTTRQGKLIEVTWADTANRLDDEAHGNRDSKQIVEISCEKEQIRISFRSSIRHKMRPQNERGRQHNVRF